MNENPFKRIIPDDELPEAHKKKVISAIDSAKLLLEIADLFTFKQARSNGIILQTLLENSNSAKK